MANAKRVKNDAKLVTETIKRYVPQPDTIQLTLTVQEAETLRVIGNRIGGHPSGRRGDIDRITAALDAAGIRAESAAHNGHFFAGNAYQAFNLADGITPFAYAKDLLQSKDRDTTFYGTPYYER